MAIVTINNEDLKQLEKFEICCLNCGSKNIEIQIDWASYPSCSWNITTMICNDCHEDEKIRESYINYIIMKDDLELLMIFRCLFSIIGFISLMLLLNELIKCV